MGCRASAAARPRLRVCLRVVGSHRRFDPRVLRGVQPGRGWRGSRRGGRRPSRSRPGPVPRRPGPAPERRPGVPVCRGERLPGGAGQLDGGLAGGAGHRSRHGDVRAEPAVAGGGYQGAARERRRSLRPPGVMVAATRRKTMREVARGSPSRARGSRVPAGPRAGGRTRRRRADAPRSRPNRGRPGPSSPTDTAGRHRPLPPPSSGGSHTATRIGSVNPTGPTPVRATMTVPTPLGSGVGTVIRVSGTLPECRSHLVGRLRPAHCCAPNPEVLTGVGGSWGWKG